jgi:glycosyltransferase involved in cell wall biosynthesis
MLTNSANIIEPYLVSIVIPNYNKSRFIAETLESILNQKHQNWEVFVVDDGSTDHSIQVIETYSKNDTRFKLIQRNRLPKGGSTCRNIGLEKSKGEYLIFLDSDDLLTPSCLKNRLDFYMKNPNLDFMVFSGGTFFKQPGDSHSKWIATENNHLNRFLSHNLPWQTSMPIWKTSFLKKLGGFDEAYPRLQDVELHTRVLLESNVKYKIIKCEEVDFFYRIDEKRKLKSPYNFLETFINAVEIYCAKMGDIINMREDKSNLFKALNGTYQAAFISVQVQYDVKAISKEERKKLFEQIAQFQKPKGLFILYIQGLKLGIHKIKGYNWLFRKTLTLK